MTTPHNTQTTNMASKTSWLLNIPLKQIDQTYTNDNFKLNLFSWSIPEMEILTTSISNHAYSVPISTGVKNEAKSTTFSYIIDSHWQNFLTLYNWYSMVANDVEYNGISETKKRVDFDVTLVSNFKKPIFRIKYYGGFLKTLGRLDLTYQTSDREPLVHSFVLGYAYHEVINLTD